MWIFSPENALPTILIQTEKELVTSNATYLYQLSSLQTVLNIFGAPILFKWLKLYTTH